VPAKRVASIRPHAPFEMLSEGVIAMKLARILALSLTMLFLAACGGDGATPASPGQTTEPAPGT